MAELTTNPFERNPNPETVAYMVAAHGAYVEARGKIASRRIGRAFAQELEVAERTFLWAQAQLSPDEAKMAWREIRDGLAISSTGNESAA